MRKFLTAAAVAGVVLYASAASAYDMKGVGTAKCDVLVNAFTSAPQSEKLAFVTGIGQWAFGYMTGRNGELPRNRRKDLAPLSSDDTAVFILRQCGNYPNAFVYQIVDVIFDELPYNSPGA